MYCADGTLEKVPLESGSQLKETLRKHLMTSAGFPVLWVWGGEQQSIFSPCETERSSNFPGGDAQFECNFTQWSNDMITYTCRQGTRPCGQLQRHLNHNRSEEMDPDEAWVLQGSLRRPWISKHALLSSMNQAGLDTSLPGGFALRAACAHLTPQGGMKMVSLLVLCSGAVRAWEPKWDICDWDQKPGWLLTIWDVLLKTGHLGGMSSACNQPHALLLSYCPCSNNNKDYNCY